MSLEFVDDAICLSGLTGSRLKCELVGRYYSLWWSITSGGNAANFDYQTSIIELDAGTGEVYIKDISETILGSSGHALNLKCSNPNAGKLKVILVEKDPSCYSHLKNVIHKRWDKVDISIAEGPIERNSLNIYLLNTNLDNALNTIEQINLGNALFLFDPLRSVNYEPIEKVARNRIKQLYGTGTEFIIFVFTSDWFLGREDFSALPTTSAEEAWSTAENRTVIEADAFFDSIDWRNHILTPAPIHEREDCLIELYRKKLHKWFRHVLPMPFNPKSSQIFHLFICSNYAAGIRATRDFYCDLTINPRYSPNNSETYKLFKERHPELLLNLDRRHKPLEWRMLWAVIKTDEEGICDCMSSDFNSIENDLHKRQKSLDWLEKNNYLVRSSIVHAWNSGIKQYQLNWQNIQDKIRILPPPPLKPLSLKPLSLEDISR